MNRFFKWAFEGRANNILKLSKGELNMDKLFLSFTSHNPAFITNGSAGLNGSIKGIGFAPKEEFLRAALDEYKEHIKTYAEGDKSYQERGLQLLIKHLYGEEARKNVDFTKVYGLEMAYKHTYQNLLENNNITLMFYQPPMISYEVRGKAEIIGERHTDDEKIDPFELPLIQQFVNAQHDVYHSPNVEVWKKTVAYKITFEEFWDKSAGRGGGFGTKIED
jgi:hypothetical protein